MGAPLRTSSAVKSITLSLALGALQLGCGTAEQEIVEETDKASASSRPHDIRRCSASGFQETRRRDASFELLRSA